MKKIAVTIYNFLRNKFLILKAKTKYRDFYPYIFALWAKNFGVALDISCLRKLDIICQKLKPRLIFEFGSGISTVLLANYAQNNPCSITVLEDNPFYLNQTKQNTFRKYQHNKIAFILAQNQYRDFLEKQSFAEKVDLVIIDGPEGEKARISNKDFYEKIISPKTCCIIDDTDRLGINSMARDLAQKNSLKKLDFQDTFYSKRHRYSILLPQNVETEEII